MFGIIIKNTIKTIITTKKGGLIHDRLFTRSGVQEYANMESIETLHAQLSHSLSQAVASTANLLVAPTTSLVQALQQHVKSAQIDQKAEKPNI